MSVAGDYPMSDSTNRQNFADTSYTIPGSVIDKIRTKNQKVRVVFRVKTNRGFDDQGTAYTGSRGSGAAVVDNVTYQIGGGGVVRWGEFENASDSNINPGTTAVVAWKST